MGKEGKKSLPHVYYPSVRVGIRSVSLTTKSRRERMQRRGNEGNISVERSCSQSHLSRAAAGRRRCLVHGRLQDRRPDHPTVSLTRF